jgi:hypothetical protein
MNALLAFIPKQILAGLALALLAATFIQSCRVGDLQEENAAYETAVEQCAKTNAQNKDAVEFLKLQHSQCLDDRREDETRIANAAAAWEAERQLLQEQAENAEQRTVEVFREPSCAELAQINVTDICPAYADGLRRRAEDYNGIRNDNR